MSDETYEKKFNEMQKYLPFLQKIIEKLKVNNNLEEDNPRKGQLQKMEMLHNLLTTREKKLKLDTLLKCEGVLMKLHSKMEKSNFFQNNIQNSTTRSSNNVDTTQTESKPIPVPITLDIIDITGPSSPPNSPTIRSLVPILPVEIPTERCSPALENIPLPGETKNCNNSQQRNSQHEKLNISKSSGKTCDKTKDNNLFNKITEDSRRNCWNATTSNSASSCIPTIITSAATPSPSAKFRNPEPPFIRNQEHYSFHHPIEQHSFPVHHGNEIYRMKPPDPHQNRASTESAYSPEELWDEFSKTTQKKPNSLSSSNTRPIPVLGSSYNSPRTPNVPPVFDKIIYQYKKPNIDCVAQHSEEKKIFSRLGAKVDQLTKEPFENFSINVKNDRMKPQKSKSSSIPSSSLPIEIKKVPQPPLADVLKSPPLTALDISELLDETVNNDTETSFPSTSLSGIGTRRPPKSTDASSKSSTPVSSLDMVRKKFAMITKSSPQCSESPASPPTLRAQEESASATNERIALKYHPHPRVERVENFFSTSGGISDPCETSSRKTSDPRQNSFKTVISPKPPAPYNVLPTINMSDPRLKKSASTATSNVQSKPCKFGLPSATPDVASSFASTTTYPRFPNESNLLGNKYPVNEKNSQLKPASQVLKSTSATSQSIQCLNSPEENWDSSPVLPIDDRYKQSLRNSPEIVERSQRASATKDYSSEENWDSDPEPVVSKKLPEKTDVPSLNAVAPKTHVSPSVNQLVTPIGLKVDPRVSLSEKPVRISPPSSDPRVPVLPFGDRYVPSVRKSPEIVERPQRSFATKDYSSEENWDSDPEPVVAKKGPANTAVPPKTSLTPNANRPVTPTLLKVDPRVSFGESPLSVTPPFIDPRMKNTRPHEFNAKDCQATKTYTPSVRNVAPHNQQTHPTHTPSNSNSRFSAVLNDQRERMKYFESKKQKHNITPRTYAEFKEAKARAAAEEAKRRSAAEESVSQSAASIPEHKGTAQPKDATKKQDSHNRSKESTMCQDKRTYESKPKDLRLKDASLTKKSIPPSPETNLDKLYRSSTFSGSSELSKTITNFKIPKKHTETEIQKDDIALKPDRKEITHSEKFENQLKTKSQKDAKYKIVDKTEVTNTKSKPLDGDSTDKTQIMQKVSSLNKKPETETLHSQSKDKKKVKKSNSTISEKSNNIRDKLAIDENHPTLNVKNKDKEIDTDADKKTKIQPEKKSAQKNSSKYQEETSQNSEVQKSEHSKVSKGKISEDINSTYSCTQSTAVDDGINAQKTARNFIDEVYTSSLIEDTVPTLKSQTTNIDLGFNSKDPRLQFLRKSPEEAETISQPQRITRRRCTMISYGSAPEVDKAKILSANALLFEDLQDKEKLQRKADEIKKQQANRKSKNLAEMFQKTDDNCTVSTQNIISGKRRTRTTVNFNEVKQSLAVFKHKKPAAEVKKEIIEQAEEVIKSVKPKAGNPSAKKQTKKTANSSKQTLNEIKAEDQSCAVSSTTSQSEETPTCSKQVNKKSLINSTVADNEPSSSAKSSYPTPTSEEEQHKQEFLEGLLQDMKNPNLNHEFIFGLLSQILNAEKFQQVKRILESPPEENVEHMADEVEDDEEEASDVEIQPEEQPIRIKTEDSTKKLTKTPAKRKIVVKKKRTNELERLNLDIRDMFISKGVITATGRRMCTLAAAGEAIEKPEGTSIKKRDDKNVNNKTPFTPVLNNDKTENSSPIRIRKSKVVISPINFNLLRRSTRSTAVEESPKDSTTPKSDDDQSSASKKSLPVLIKTESNSTVEQKETPPRRKMPVLKPNTPIKLIEEQQLEAIEEKINSKSSGCGGKKRKLESLKLQIKIKPCPKSKKSGKALSRGNSITSDREPSDDSEDDIQLASLRKRIKSNNSENDVENSAKNCEKNIINTNPHWHSLSKYAHWCVFCDTRILHLAIHYKEKHKNKENYSSRIAPTILQHYKQGKLSTPEFGIVRKGSTYWFYRCPFCLQHNRNMTRSWLEHFTKHTGEYFFECSHCHKPANKPMLIEKHIQHSCPKGKLIRKDCQTHLKLIKAHICHMCNFIQLNRSNLERHLIEQHGCDPEHVTVLGYSINLMNAEGVEIVDLKKAAELEAAALEKHNQDAVVSIDDDDDEEATTAHTSANNQEKIKVPTESKSKANERLSTDKSIASNGKTKQLRDQAIDESISKYNTVSANPTTEVNVELTQKLAKQQIIAEAQEKTYSVKKMRSVETVESSRKSITESDGLNDKIDADTESDSVRMEKFIVDIQDEVLAAAARAEAEENAREAAQCSNIFMPTQRNNTDSPTIDCLTQSLRTIEQAEQQLQQATLIVNAQIQQTAPNKGEAITSSYPAISMAERLSQRFKDIQVRRVTDKDEALVENSLTVPENTASANSSYSEGNLVIAEDMEDVQPEDNSLTCCVQTPDVDTEDDGNWEDIEISESAPNATVSAASSNKEKHKKKKIYQSLSRLYATINKKGPNSSKAKKTITITTTSNKKQSQQSSDCATNSQSNARTLISNLQDLLPDSPCNDPMELVPELAPVEPLQDLNDISAILEANFSTLDAQSIMQQMDINMPADSICINTEGQQQSIQDALEFVTEQQQQDSQQLPVSSYNQLADATTMNSKQLQTVIYRIQNLGFSKNVDGGAKFYCISENCSFLFSNEAFGLESHYLNEHPKLKWNGYCITCLKQVMQRSYNSDTYSISEEMQHMLEKHIPTGYKTVDQVVEDLVVKSDPMPRIKLRRLTGDCLSSNQTTEHVELPKDSQITEYVDLIEGSETTEHEQLPKDNQLAEHADMPKDISNMTLSDLLRAEQRPITKPFPTLQIKPVSEDTAQQQRDAMPLFKNIGNEFSITAVASVGTANAGPPPSDNNSSDCQLQIASVRSLNVDGQDQTEAAAASNLSSDCAITLPKISNVCSLNLRATSQKSNNAAAALWQQQIETDRIELDLAAKESQEVSRILQDSQPRGRRSPPTDKLGELLANTLRDDSPTLVAETLPVSTATSGDFLITQTVSTQFHDTESNSTVAAPQLGFNISIAAKAIVSEPSVTTPEHTSSSAVRYQFKCMGNGCKYQTRVTIAMSEHLRFHERRNFSTQREYMRCSFCAHISDDVNEYIKHTESEHPVQVGNACSANTNKESTSTSCPLTQKIQNILNGTTTNKVTSSDVNESNTSVSTTKAAPAEVPFKQQLQETIKEMVAQSGLPESKLYRCVIDGCKTVLTEASFHTHLVYHLSTLGTLNVNNYEYKCPHCSAIYHRATGIKAHIKSHARHSHFCYVCMETATNSTQMTKHFSEKHWKVAGLNTLPLLVVHSANTNKEPEKYFVAHGGKKLTPLDVQQFGEKLVSEWQRKKAASKTHFKPSEIDLLPIQPIFRNEVYCADCLYKTKVRTNMFRHLQLHKSSSVTGVSAPLHMASVDPVNPVPCLNSGERHFDKMCNLASSSLVPGAASSTTKVAFKPPYVFVPEWRRFTCGVVGCQYLTVSDDIFRAHLNSLHQSVQIYWCPFCKEELCTRSLASERILQHLRLHGSKLYQCEECDYLHYMKNVVERHINERHAVLRVNLITHERSVEDAAEGTKTMQVITGKKFKENPVKAAASAENANQSSNSADANLNNTTLSSASNNAKLKWECDLCKHRTITHNQMIHHCHTQHNCKQQYQCVHCPFGGTQLAHIMSHIDDKHPAKTREARYIFHKLFSSAQDKEADTRPLWQRDDPTRVRHIRGILMENEEESALYQKHLSLNEDYEDFEEFVSINAEKDMGKSSSSSRKVASVENQFKYSCYHCDFKSASFAELRNKHWQTTHNVQEQKAKPFWFRLLPNFKCAECKVFCGDHSDLQLHLQNVHKTRIYIAADASDVQSEIMVCGYCEFKYERTEQLVKHYQRVGHKPHDMKRFLPEHLAFNTKLGISETYVQCMLCTELFANRMAIVAHARLQHNGEGNFAFKELQNILIYRCAICPFHAVDELTTLRHMIDHYGGFKRCFSCQELQTTFNSYMQHCYTEHRAEVKRFSSIYTFKDISKYLENMFVIFPNGLVVNKKNLSATPYGSDKCMQELYTEICKTSQEPPIPRLSIARLVARKSIEAKQSSRNGSPNPDEHVADKDSPTPTGAAIQMISDHLQIQAKKIAKRRKTVAFDSRNDFSFFNRNADVCIPDKKRKVSENSIVSKSILSEEDRQNTVVEQPYSFYGKKSEPIDLSQIYTKVAIGGLDTPLTIDKFKMLFKIDAQVLVEKLNIHGIDLHHKNNHEDYRHIKKACPASQKYKYV